ncbi:MAG: ribonuclease P protein component [Candidatus Komeilibacteria bacterium RIFCSPLOWO2_01_FULL_53_11]|uniref:Ribonuclease P protein component n=1 Tax=Candidatus Komeilibacteria bacterium RIFCSPLOWO2_01_FULL_53_11 TaxID=1798552 RepID=A0A1G2BPF6_9BACT|nr:MAG: ribonuclease P protein component [Candidatus Komeilibacteria bacterium RIFCSPLOWO2_01_FULL_53_11]
MLPATHRLRSDEDFKRLMQRGRRYFSRALVARVLATKEPVTRVGFVVSAKVAKKAVLRNSIKRRLREIVRKELPRIRAGYDVALIAKNEAARYDYWALRDEAISLFTHAGIFNDQAREPRNTRSSS